MTTIDADLIIAGLIVFGKLTAVVPRDLNLVREKIESQIPELFIDVSSGSICMGCDHRPDMFKWENDVISPNQHSEEFFTEEYFNKYFLWRLRPEWRSVIIEIFTTHHS